MTNPLFWFWVIVLYDAGAIFAFICGYGHVKAIWMGTACPVPGLPPHRHDRWTDPIMAVVLTAALAGIWPYWVYKYLRKRAHDART